MAVNSIFRLLASALTRHKPRTIRKHAGLLSGVLERLEDRTVPDAAATYLPGAYGPFLEGTPLGASNPPGLSAVRPATSATAGGAGARSDSRQTGPALNSAPPSTSKLSFDLAAMAYPQPSPAQASPNAGLVQVRGGRVLIDAAAETTTEALIADLRSLGARVTGSYGRMVSSWVPVAALPQLDGLSSMRLARASYLPQANGGSVTSQGDPALRADIARSQFGVDGTGITVGILSDSFDTSGFGSYAQDVATGDLPAGAIILDDSVGGGDEGRGMAQLVYDVAPGAQIAFHTAFNGEADFAQGILDLAAAGANVIVDDVVYYAEPMFQDGVIAQAVDQVVAAGVPYFSSAGNQGRQSYEAPFRNGGTFAAGAFGPGFLGGVAHDFDPGAGVDPFQRITVPSFSSIVLSFQWDDPFFSVSGGAGALSEVDIYVLDANTHQVVGGANSSNLGGDPIEIFGFDNFSSNTAYELMIVSRSGPLPGRVKYVNFGTAMSPEYDTQSGTTFGHANAAGAASVGSAYYGNTPAFGVSPPLVESFTTDPFLYESSAGGLSVLFDTAGNRLATPDVRSTPDFVAPDGGNTTFFGFDIEGDNFPNFFGTSAAAPHAAGVAALMLQLSPNLTPATIYQAMASSAVDMDDPATPGFDVGFDTGTGAGLIQADAAISALGLVVISTTPAAGSTVSTAPTTFVVNFNTSYTPGTVDASDLTVNGIPATSVTLIDADTLTFTFASSPVTSEGLQTMHLAAGALTRLSDGAPLLEYNRTFRYDILPLAVTSTSPPDGSIISLPFSTLDVHFNEPVKASSIQVSDFVVDMGSVVAATLVGPNTVRLTLTGLNAEGTLTLTVPAVSLTDLFDNPNPAEFTSSYDLDFDTVSFPTPLIAANPRGSRVYAGSVSAFVNPAADTDTFTLFVDPGQFISVIVSPADAGLRPVVKLYDPSNTLMASDTADAAGLAAFLSAVPTVGTVAGTYRIVVSGAGGTGGYTARVVLNAAVEAEGLAAGASNNTLATAQNIDASLLSLGGPASRAAVQGDGDTASDPEYYSFTLTAGETVSVGLTGAGMFVLRNGAGTVLAASSAGTNVGQALRNFSVASSGTYYVSFDATGGYTLVVTRGAEFETEKNDTPVQAQDVFSSVSGGTQFVAGYLDPASQGLFAISWEDGRIFELDPVTGALVRTLPAPDTFIQTNPFGLNLDATGTELFYNAGSFYGDTTIARLDINTGALLSSFFGPGFGYTDIAVIGNEIFAADFDFGVIRVLDANTGDELRTLPAVTGYEGLAADAPAGRLFAVSQGTGELYELDLLTGDVIREAVQQNVIFYQQDLALVGDELYVSEVFDFGYGNFINVYDKNTFEFKRTLDVTAIFGPNNFVSGLGGSGIPQGVAADYYRVTVGASGTLTVETMTPGDGPGEFVNTADLVLRLRDSGGNVVAEDDNGAADGRNALLDLTGLTPGEYTLEIAPSPLTPTATTGEYTLRIVGNQAAPPGFEVVGTDIPDGQRYRVQPATFTVDFSDAILLTTLQASDLRIDGAPAPAFTLVDGDTITFTLPAGLADGLHTLSFAAGSILDIQGTSLLAFSSTFYLDTVAPRVTATSVAPNGVVAPGALTYQVTFNEPMLAGNLSADDFALRGNFRGVNYTATGFSFNAAGTVLTLSYTGLPDDDYTLTLVAGANDGSNFTDLVGNALDGEFTGSFPSGNGSAGGNFAIGFDADVATEAFPTPLTGNQLAGSLIYDASVVRTVAFAGDTDSFTLNVSAGQTITLLVKPTTAGLRPTVEVRGPGGVLLGTAAAAATGQNALLQTVPAATAGTYTITVSGAGGTTGLYTAQAVLNAALESEQNLTGVDNDSRSTAQSLTPAFVALDTTLAHGSRAAVVGRIGTGPAVASETFESGTLQASFATYTSDPTRGRIQVAPPPFPGVYTGNGSGYALLMDNRLDDGVYALNEAVYTVNLSGLSGAILSFTHANFNDENELLPASFTGHVNGDGVSISADGVTWYTVLNAPSNGVWQAATIDLGAAAAAAGISLGANFKIKFQQYDNFAINTDGRGYDDIVIGPADSGDFYSLSLSAGERVTVGVKALAAGTVNVALVNAAGVTLATGVAGATNLSKVISGFQVPAAGTYYLQVTGSVNTDYSLVATRGAAFDTEGNDSQGAAQTITGAQGALGALTAGRTVTLTWTDSGWWDATGAHTATNKNYLTGLATGREYRDYFVFDLNGISQPVSSATLRAYNPRGGTDNGNGYISPDATETYALFDVTTPLGALQGTGSGQTSIFADLGGGTSYGSYSASAADNGRVISIPLNAAALAALNASLGNSFALGGAITTISGTANQALFAFTGAATNTRELVLTLAPDAGDWYKVTLGAGETVLEVETATPADGSGVFGNTLNPKIQVFNASGVDITGAVAILADGRNERVRITGLTAGATYSVKVSAEGGTAGEYFVGVKTLRTPTITTKVDDALPVGTGPDGTFSVPNPVGNGWRNVTGSGYLNDYTVHTDNVNEVASNFATWTIKVTPDAFGNFELFTTWVPRPQNATNATYEIREGTILRATVVVNQKLAPNDTLLFGTTLAESLGVFSKLNPATTFFSVRLLTVGANGDVVSDGVFDPPTGEAAAVPPVACLGSPAVSVPATPAGRPPASAEVAPVQCPVASVAPWAVAVSEPTAVRPSESRAKVFAPPAAATFSDTGAVVSVTPGRATEGMSVAWPPLDDLFGSGLWAATEPTPFRRSTRV